MSNSNYRYGNPGFRDFFETLDGHSEDLVKTLLPPDLHPAKIELAPYLVDSFGNSTRIDYGTGHETTFVAFLYCLARLGFFSGEDGPGLVLFVF